MTIKTELLKRYLADYISNSISDFDKVEKIICLFEKNYIDTDCCHDF